MCLGGCLVTFPLLLPIHATGGVGLTDLDKLTIGNVKDPQKLITHVFVAWAFFGNTSSTRLLNFILFYFYFLSRAWCGIVANVPAQALSCT